MVAKIFLDGFNAVAALQCHHCVCMPKVMKSSLWAADLCCDPFEAVIHGPVGKAVSDFVGEDQMAVHPARAYK